jgi:hypothetical protein
MDYSRFRQMNSRLSSLATDEMFELLDDELLILQ